MLGKSLWGNDTKKYSVKFNELPDDMRLNYTALLLSAAIAHLQVNPLPRNSIKLSLQDSARWWLVRAWVGRFTTIDQQNKGTLNWDMTTKVILGSINKVLDSNKTISSLDDPDFIKSICKKTHDSMVENRLWGNDTGKYFVPYEKLEQHMKIWQVDWIFFHLRSELKDNKN